MSETGLNLDLFITVGDATFHATGPPELVMQAFAEFKVLTAIAPPGKPKPQSKEDTPEDDDGARAIAPQTSVASKVPLPKFLESDEIKANPAIATAIVVWAADHEGKPSLTTREIERYWKDTRLKVPGNTSRDIGVAMKNGWLIKSDGNTYSASGYGRQAIGLV